MNVRHEADNVVNREGVARDQIRVLIADDSPTVRCVVESTLRESGYSQVIAFEHGRELWDYLTENVARSGDIREVADVVISDVEMPSMDGLHLTRRIRADERMKDLPVVLYSSILTPSNRKKGEAVGADAQITKPELHRVVELADKFGGRRLRERRAAEEPAMAGAPG